MWYYLTHRWEDKGVHTFPKGTCLKVNVIVWLEFKLTYYDPAVQHFNHYTTEIIPSSRLVGVGVSLVCLPSWVCSYTLKMSSSLLALYLLLEKCWVQIKHLRTWSNWVALYFKKFNINWCLRWCYGVALFPFDTVKIFFLLLLTSICNFGTSIKIHANNWRFDFLEFWMYYTCIYF